MAHDFYPPFYDYEYDFEENKSLKKTSSSKRKKCSGVGCVKGYVLLFYSRQPCKECNGKGYVE